MEYKILNDGQPNDDGFIEAVIESHEGKRVSSFKGKTERELLEQLLTSQVKANREIARLRKPDTARQPLSVNPHDISPADRLRLSTQMTDPSKVVEAVSEIVAARTGIEPDKLGAEFARRSREDQDAFYGNEAQAFRDEHPEFYPVPQNRDALFEELKANGWDLTRNNLAIAFQTLWERGDMIPWPSDEHVSAPTDEPTAQPVVMQPRPNGTRTNGQQAQPAPQPRARTIATTGLRTADASATPPPPVRKQKYTRADIECMSRGEFNEKLQSDPEFRRQVDAMSA